MPHGVPNTTVRPPPKPAGATAPKKPPPPPPRARKSDVASDRGGRPPPPRGPSGDSRPRPPPPPPRKAKGDGGSAAASPGTGGLGTKRPAATESSAETPRRRRLQRWASLDAYQMRDVTAFRKKQQVGQGTYGSVFMGADQVTGEIVALKRINTEEEANGFPITALREVKLLKAMSHENIVRLKEMVTSSDSGDVPKNVFMVMEYLEYDLTGIIESPEIKITQDHIKSWSNQLLKGVHYMHANLIIHRDLKSSNLLIGRRGELKIADWGLARTWNPEETRRLTSPVITLWYRPTELLLGCAAYGSKVDMWSVGCIVAEMFRRGGLLRGTNDASQLDLIFRTLGHPTEADWPNIRRMCPLWENFEPGDGEEGFPRRIREELKNRLPTSALNWMTPHAIDLIDNLLAHNPEKRWSTREALVAEWFFDHPMVKDADKLNMKFGVDSAHEWEARKRHKEVMHQRKAAQAAGGTNAVC